jgi:hypothetical protein
MLSKLPKDIIHHIQNYLFEKCNECNKEYIAHEMDYDVTTIYYKAMFDDDFPFPRIYKSYKYLCKKCIKELNEKLIAPLKY